MSILIAMKRVYGIFRNMYEGLIYDNLIFTSCIIPLKYAIISKLPMIYNIETNVKHV